MREGAPRTCGHRLPWSDGDARLYLSVPSRSWIAFGTEPIDTPSQQLDNGPHPPRLRETIAVRLHRTRQTPTTRPLVLNSADDTAAAAPKKTKSTSTRDICFSATYGSRCYSTLGIREASARPGALRDERAGLTGPSKSLPKFLGSLLGLGLASYILRRRILKK